MYLEPFLDPVRAICIKSRMSLKIASDLVTNYVICGFSLWFIFFFLLLTLFLKILKIDFKRYPVKIESIHTHTKLLFTQLLLCVVLLPYWWLAVQRYTHRTNTNHIYGWYFLCVLSWIIKSHTRKYGMHHVSTCHLYYGFSELKLELRGDI
jgi:hypothetical protein